MASAAWMLACSNPAGDATQALGFALYDTLANWLCFESHGNTTRDKTVVLNCRINKPQRLLLRMDLAPESLDYSVVLSGPVTLIAPSALVASATVAGAGSTDIDGPMRLGGNRVKANGPGKPVAYYYVFNAGPGELTLTGDGSNTSAASTEALRLGLYTLRSERLCELTLGNTRLEKRAVTTCLVDNRQPVILRADLSAETVAFRARVEGPYDFDEFVPPKVITIALDSSVLFDTGKINRQARSAAGVARSFRACEKVCWRRGVDFRPHRQCRHPGQQSGPVHGARAIGAKAK